MYTLTRFECQARREGIKVLVWPYFTHTVDADYGLSHDGKPGAQGLDRSASHDPKMNMWLQPSCNPTDTCYVHIDGCSMVEARRK